MQTLKLYSVELTIEVVVLAPSEPAATRVALDHVDECMDYPDVSSVVEINDVDHVPEDWRRSIPFCDVLEEYPEDEMSCAEVFDFWKQQLKQQQEEAAAQAEQERRQLKLFPERS